MINIDYRKAIENTYSHICNVFIKKPIKNENFETEFITETYIENQPCRLSFGTSNTTTNTDVAGYTQQIQLFISEKIKIQEGSSIEVIANGVSTIYKQSGKPKVYPCHQQIILEIERLA